MKVPRSFVVLFVAAGSARCVGTLPAANLTWDISTVSGIQDGAGTWDVNTTANWNNGTTNVNWTSSSNAADTAVFGGGGTSGTVTVSTATGTVYVGGLTFNQSGYSITGGTLTLVPTSGTTIIDTTTTTGTTTISNVLTGSTSLTKNGTGTLSLTATNTFTGGVILNGGILAIAGGGGFGNATASSGAASPAQLTFGGNSTLLIGNNSLLATRPFLLNSNVTGTVDTSSNTGSAVLGVISGAGSLNKAGSGVLLLNNTNTYTGTTTVTAGTLQINGSTSASSAVTVASGGTLGGTGSIGGTVSVGNNATLQAGGVSTANNTTPTVIGNLRTGALTLSSGSVFNAVATSSTSYSSLTASNTANVGGSSFSITPTSGASFTSGSVLQLITSSITGNFTNSSYTAGGYVFTADYTDNPGFFDVKVTAVPEPATWLAGTLLLASAVQVGRKRIGQTARRA